MPVRICDNMCLVDIEATTIPDAWFQCIWNILHYGRKFKIDRGSFAGQQRMEFDYITISMSVPGFNSEVDINEMLPHLREGLSIPNPVEDDYLAGYLPYLMTGELQPGESYTYGQRLTKAPIDSEWVSEHKYGEHKYTLIQDDSIWINNKIITEGLNYSFFLNQVELLIETYKRFGHRNNQMVLQVAQPSDMLLQDPPCLRLIDTRIQGHKLHFFVEFRSWDLWGGFPANLAAIEILKQYIAGELKIGTGITVARSKGLHLYNYTWELAELVANKTYEESHNAIMG